MGDLQALSVHPTCIQFVLDGSRVVLRLNAAYTPKVLSGAYSALSFELPTLSNLSIDSEEDRKLHALCGLYVGMWSRRRLCVLLISCLCVLPTRFWGSRCLSSAFHTGLWRRFLLHTRAEVWPCLLGCVRPQQGAWQHHGHYLEECLWRTFVRQHKNNIKIEYINNNILKYISQF